MYLVVVRSSLDYHHVHLVRVGCPKRSRDGARSAAYRLVEGGGVLSGYSAAMLLGAGCAPTPDVHAEVTVPGASTRAWSCTATGSSPARRLWSGTCAALRRCGYDLARLDDPVEAVVGVDRLANAHRFNPDLLLNFRLHYHRARGNDRIPEAGEPERIIAQLARARQRTRCTWW
jgi:hypothetical protein